MTKERRTIRALWMRIQEPRVVTALQTLEYVVLGVLAGFATLIHPPQSIIAVIGTGMMHLVGVLILTGATVAIIGTPGGYWWLEKLGLIAMIGGATAYLSTIIYLDITAGGSRLMQTGFVLGMIVALIKRAVRIWPLEFDPEKDAIRLANRK